jgi:hypothetical protein
MEKNQKYISKIPLINVDLIIVKHFQTLIEDSSSFCFYLYFLIIPLITAIILIYLNKPMTDGSANTLITAFSIFTGLLLNVILIIFSIVDRRQERKNTDKWITFEHLYANTIYALLLSTILLLFLILLVVLNDWKNSFLIIFFSFIIYFCVVHFVMTLLMIFKRLFVLLFE